MMYAPLILLAEDEPIISLQLRLELEQFGYQVFIASDAKEILQLYAQHLPEIIILNFWMKEGPDGIELIQSLRNKHYTRVMFITGARSQDVKKAKDYREYSVLYKPFTRKQLRSFLLSSESSGI